MSSRTYSSDHRILENISYPVTKHRNRLHREGGESPPLEIFLNCPDSILCNVFMDNSACAGMLHPLRPPLSAVAEGETGIHLSVIKSVMHQQHLRINQMRRSPHVLVLFLLSVCHKRVAERLELSGNFIVKENLRNLETWCISVRIQRTLE